MVALVLVGDRREARHRRLNQSLFEAPGQMRLNVAPRTNAPSMPAAKKRRGRSARSRAGPRRHFFGSSPRRRGSSILAGFALGVVLVRARDRSFRLVERAKALGLGLDPASRTPRRDRRLLAFAVAP